MHPPSILASRGSGTQATRRCSRRQVRVQPTSHRRLSAASRRKRKASVCFPSIWVVLSLWQQWLPQPLLLGPNVGSKVASKILDKQAGLDVAKGEGTMRDVVREQSQASGYITPPERGIKAGAAGLAGKAKVEKIVSEKNEANAPRRLGA